MAAIWRSELPQYAARAGFQRSLGDTRLVSETDLGGENSRRRATRRVDPYAFQMFFTDHQVEVFWRFWEIDAAGGNLPFWFPGQPKDIGLTDEDGAFLTDFDDAVLTAESWWLVEFAKRQPPPVFALRGLDYVATLQIGRIL